MKKSSSHMSFSTSKASLYGTYVGRGPLMSAPLKQVNEADRLTIERGVFAYARGTHVRLQRRHRRDPAAR